MGSNYTEEPFAWLKALLAIGDFEAAECLVNKAPPDFEKVYSLLLIAKAYLEQEKLKLAITRSAQAVTLWRTSRNEWWFLIILGDLLRGLIECGQSVLSEKLIQESVSLVEQEEDAWLETHGWCGLALGAVSLGRIDDSEMFIARASEVAKSRPTTEKRASTMSTVDMTLKTLKKLSGCDEDNALQMN